ncbi:unnamed protein product [Rangifer tarandus platyrhynchus]|uniref:Uncharacterized protein n=1 Tax=Rangifer tarandus platyrhynchus TaxID=3082113 RepID=A0ABN8XWM3_RANTA|nr:unnamed protein product [Rangifer tarandus platyrhynchus]
MTPPGRPDPGARGGAFRRAAPTPAPGPGAGPGASAPGKGRRVSLAVTARALTLHECTLDRHAARCGDTMEAP